VTAVLIATAFLIVAWRAMVALPWAIDGLIVAVAVLAWAYWFERGDGN